MYKIVAERVLNKEVDPATLKQQLNKCANSSLSGSRGTGWQFKIQKLYVTGQGPVKYTTEIVFSTTSKRESLKAKWPNIVKKFSEVACSSSLKSNPWVIIEPTGYKQVAETAKQEKIKSEEKKRLSQEPKNLGVINLEITNQFSRIYGREAQIRRVHDALILGHRTNWDKRKNSLLDGPPGCHIKGTLILKSDGSQVPVEDIKVGDKLLYPNGNKTVVNLVRGEGNLYTVTPIKGEPFVVNEDHILTLSRSKGKSKGQLLDVSLKEWLNWSNNKKSNYKLIRSEEVEFDRKHEDLIIPSYALGLILGDGSIVKNQSPRITCHELDFPFVPEITYLAQQFGLKVSVNPREGKKGYIFELSITGTQKARNPLMEALNELGLEGTNSGNKFVPDSYKFSSARDRLELLAGYIDTDGEHHCGVITTSSKSKKLSDDITFIARSLGFAAYQSEKEVFYDNEYKTYYCVNLSGDLNKIPCRHNRKRPSKRKQIKNVLRTGFDVKFHSFGDYFGFNVDGDHRYLIGDFTITHNCGKTEIMRAFAKTLGSENEAWLWFDATSMTKAGAIEEIIEAAVVPPVLFIEEIEKCEENALRWLLGIMDTRGEIRRTNYRVGNQAKDVRMVVIASANNVKLLKQVMSGALYSRFQNKIYCPEPDREIMRQILTREVDEIKGKVEWVEPTLKFSFDKWGITDPRDVINIMSCGGDRLINGEYQKDYEATMHPLERKLLLEKKKKRTEKMKSDAELQTQD